MSNAPLGQKGPWKARITFKNGESSASISQGQSVVLSMNGTDDGFAVVLPSTAAAAKTATLFQGIAAPCRIDPTATVAGQAKVGEWFDVVVAGWSPVTKLVKATKASSTSAWPSFAAGAVGDALSVNTVANCLQDMGSIAGSTPYPPAILLDTYASATTVASDVYSTVVPLSATALTVNVRAWIRSLG